VLELRRRHAGAMTTRLTARTAVLMTLPPLLWAGNAVVGRLAVGSVPPLTLNFLRWALAALFLLPFGWRMLRAPRSVLQRWPYLLAAGLLGVGTYNSLQYLALVTSTPINVTLIAASMPVWMLAVGALFYGIHPTARQYLGAALSLAGVVLVIARGDLATLARVHLVPGDLYVLVAIVAWSFYSWLLAKPPAAMRGDDRPAWDWAEFLLIQTLFGLLGAGAASAGELVLTSAQVHWSGWVIVALLYVAVGPSIIAYRCWGLGVVRGGPALAAFFGNLTPLFAALLSAAVLGEPPHPYHALAFALIVAGIVVPSNRR
jgi:drug/metabolite transporter (DMT)-like permease